MAGLRLSMGSAPPAFTFVLTMGIVNLFADITYEGGGSINSPFLATLGASAAAVGITAGVGEFLGYALRSFRIHQRQDREVLGHHLRGLRH
jgi:hypothetical protein